MRKASKPELDTVIFRPTSRDARKDFKIEASGSGKVRIN